MKLKLYETHLSIIADLFPRSKKFGAHLRSPHPPVPLNRIFFGLTGGLNPQIPFIEHIVPRLE